MPKLGLTSLLTIIAMTLAGPARAQAEPETLIDVYIEMDDGVRLAADIYLPPGTPTDGSVQVPCLVELTPYRKESRAAEGAGFLPQAGFGLIEVDARGTGGSEGEYDIVFSIREQWDTAAVIDWAAQESGYCTDKVGMFGGSYSGIIQYLAASLPPERAPQHLVTIAPQRAYGDLYRDIVYHGGQVISSFGIIWSSGTTAYYTQPPTNIATADGMAAWTDHLSSNDPMLLYYLQAPYIDARYASDDSEVAYEQLLYQDSSVLTRMQHLKVPVFHLAGWFDAFTRGQLLTFQQGLAREQAGQGGPHYLAIGPWDHGGTHFAFYPDLQQRLVDWYRYWLDDGPRPDWFGANRLRYYTMRDGGLNDESGQWAEAPAWPPAGELLKLYPTADAGLSRTPADANSVTWLFDPSTGVTEWPSRWDNAAGTPTQNLDQSLDGDRGGPTFMTPVLEEDLTLAGPISLRLQASTTSLGLAGEPIADAPELFDSLLPAYVDTDFVVKLSDVKPDGTAELITEGYLRASHRALDMAQSQVVGGEVIVPVHTHLRADLDPPASGEVREYWLEIWPTAKTFPAGHRLRIDVYSADTPNHLNLLRPSLNEIVTGKDTYLLLSVADQASSRGDGATAAAGSGALSWWLIVLAAVCSGLKGRRRTAISGMAV